MTRRFRYKQSESIMHRCVLYAWLRPRGKVADEIAGSRWRLLMMNDTLPLGRGVAAMVVGPHVLLPRPSGS